MSAWKWKKPSDNDPKTPAEPKANLFSRNKSAIMDDAERKEARGQPWLYLLQSQVDPQLVLLGHLSSAAY